MTKGRPKRLKLEERIALARRYHAGDTPKVLAEAYGVPRRHVTRMRVTFRLWSLGECERTL